MLNKETSEKLQAAVLEKLTKTLSDKSSTDRFTKTMIKLVAMGTVVTLEECENMIAEVV